MKVSNFTGTRLNFVGAFSGWATTEGGVAPVNNAPVADPQSVSVLEDGYIAITLTATDPEGQPLTWAVLSGPSNGVLTGTAPNLVYTPTPNYFGSDSFTFQADDGTNLSNIATVSITVINVNDAPVANPQSLSLLEDGYLDIILTGSDPDGNPLTYSVTSGPSNGAITGTAPNIRYTPTANFFGSDSFTFVANDGYVNSSPATISLTIVNVNDAPIANPQSVTVDEDGYLVITLTGSDPEGNPLTYTVTGGPSDGYLTGTAPVLTYFPDAGYTGPDSFTFVANDGYVDSLPATVSITVEAAIPTPTLQADWTVSSTIPSELTFTRASAGTYVDSAGIIQTAATGVPRFTYDAYTLQPEGLLLEPAATNSFSSGRRLQNWDLFGASRTINTADTLAPNGTQTATKMVENTNNGEHVIYPNSTVLPAGSYPKNQRLGFSIFAKAGSRNILSVNLNQDAQNEYLTVWFYLATGETRLFSGSINAGLVHEINMEPFGNGWWRCSASFTLATGTANTPNLLRVNLTDGTLPNNWGTPNYVGNGSSIYIWGAQMEFDSKRVTSVILTDTATATRAADDLSVASTTGWYDDTAWTVLHDTEYENIVNPSASLASGTWENSTGANTNDWLRVRWSRELGQFCAVADGPGGTAGSQLRVMTSPDAISWTQRAAAQSGTANSNWSGLAWSPDLGVWVAVAQEGLQRVMTSYDGIDWTIGNAAQNNTWVDVVWSPELSLFCAVSTNGTNRVMTSPDGVTWTARTPAVTTNEWRGIVWAKELGIFVAVGSDGGSSGQGAMTSPDGITWTARTSPVGATWASVTWSPELNLFVAVGYGSGTRFMTSPDGITWTARTGGNSGCLWRDVSWAPEIGKFVAVASEGVGINERVAISSDGINWTGITYAAPGSTITHTVDAASVLRSVAWSPELGVFAMVAASSGTVVTPIELRARTSTTTDGKREMLRYRSNAATDAWVTGSATGFLNSGIVNAKVARFAYYDKKLTAAELAALGV